MKITLVKHGHSYNICDERDISQAGNIGRKYKTISLVHRCEHLKTLVINALPTLSALAKRVGDRTKKSEIGELWTSV